jgi:hypothetical protein
VRAPGRGWARAWLLQVQGELALLHLLDHGTEETVATSELRRLETSFDGPALCRRLHLPDVLPVGGGDLWTDSSCRRLAELLEQDGGLVQVTALGPDIPLPGGRSSQPALVTVTARTLGPDSDVQLPLGRALVTCGLAIPGTASCEVLSRALQLAEDSEETAECEVDDESQKGEGVETTVVGLDPSASGRWYLAP